MSGSSHSVKEFISLVVVTTYTCTRFGRNKKSPQPTTNLSNELSSTWREVAALSDIPSQRTTQQILPAINTRDRGLVLLLLFWLLLRAPKGVLIYYCKLYLPEASCVLYMKAMVNANRVMYKANRPGSSLRGPARSAQSKGLLWCASVYSIRHSNCALLDYITTRTCAVSLDITTGGAHRVDKQILTLNIH